MAQEITRKAICECGSLVITVKGDPEHHHACSCKNCQRASGSVMTVSAWYPRDQIVSIVGKTMMWQPGGEGTDVYRCANCGGGGYFLTGSYLPHCVGINVGHFADPDFPAPSHIHWWPSHPRWLGTPEEVELHNGNE